jgi:hypothetical protein
MFLFDEHRSGGWCERHSLLIDPGLLGYTCTNNKWLITKSSRVKISVADPEGSASFGRIRNFGCRIRRIRIIGYKIGI